MSPVRKVAQQADDKPVYTGERISLTFQDVEVRALLQILADTSGQNIVMNDSVQGNMTIRLQNVPWDQALDIVLKTKGLDKRKTDNVIIVAPADELAAREKAELAARKDIQELAPLRSEFVQVNYAKAQDMAALIKSQGGSLLSPRGAVTVDERTNTLLLQDTADRLADIRRLVATLDIPVRQVLIEARIVIVNDDFTREPRRAHGLHEHPVERSRWRADHERQCRCGGHGSVIGPRQPRRATAPLRRSTSRPVRGGMPDRYNVNLPVVSPRGRLAFALLGADYIVDLELSAAQAEGRGEIKSSPHVITANQKEASIEQGVGNSLPAGGVERCHHGGIQEGGAVARRSLRRSRRTIASFSTSTSRRTASVRCS